MRIFVLPCTLTCQNIGDVALLQTLVRKLKQFWPEATIQVPTRNATALIEYCPDVEPLASGDWFADHYLLGRVHRVVPTSVSRWLVRLKRGFRRHMPWCEEIAISAKSLLRPGGRDGFRNYVRAIRNADLVTMSGAGGITDVFPSFTKSTLDALNMATSQRKPTAMFSQGIGPLRNVDLCRRASEVLPQVDLIVLREGRFGLPLLRELGITGERVTVAGDDAVEMAYLARPEHIERCLGVNIRTMHPATVEPTAITSIGTVLQKFADSHDVPVVSIPIARQGDVDASAIKQVLPNYGGSYDLDEDVLDTPLKVINQVGRCRVVVSGAYHAAVFALAQGIPTVCLSSSEYFAHKFWGLAERFGAGCQVVDLQGDDLTGRLQKALDDAWLSADQVRPALLRATVEQIEATNQAYRKLRQVVAAN